MARTTPLRSVVTNAVKPKHLSTLEAIRALGRLPAGWDGQGGPPPSEDVVQIAIGIVCSLRTDEVPSPEAGPESDGGLQLDWWLGDRELEMHIRPSGALEYLLVDAGQPVKEGSIAVTNAQAIQSLIDWLQGR